jgi:hypothetical protein
MMKTKLRNKIALLFLAVILVSGQIMAFGAGERTGTYAKQSTQSTPITATPNQLNENGVLRAGGTENEGDGGDPQKIEDSPVPLLDGLCIFAFAGVGYSLFVWRKEQRRRVA